MQILSLTRRPPFQKGLGVQYSKEEATKCVSLGGNRSLTSVYSSLKEYFRDLTNCEREIWIYKECLRDSKSL